jgi:schlafen family protein
MLELNNRADLQKLVDGGIGESLTLEYKASAALEKSDRREIIKDVTAFANSAGGQIVYGIVEVDGAPQSLDNGVDPTQISAEWIDQIVSSNSSPRIQGLRIIPIPMEMNNRVAYVLSIPQATSFAPHQNSIDNKYYRRSENRSIPMHDYEVKDLMRRANKPDLWMDFLFEGSRTTQINFPINSDKSRPILLSATIGNRSSEPSLYTAIMLLIDINFTVSPQTTLGGFSEKHGVYPLGDYKIKVYSTSWITPECQFLPKPLLTQPIPR